MRWALALAILVFFLSVIYFLWYRWGSTLVIPPMGLGCGSTATQMEAWRLNSSSHAMDGKGFWDLANENLLLSFLDNLQVDNCL